MKINIEKRGKKWYLNQVVNGYRIRKVLHENKSTAMYIAKRIIQDALTKPTAKPKARTLHSLIREYIQDKIDNEDLKATTIKRYRTAERTLLSNFPADMEITELTKKGIQAFLKRRRRAGRKRSTLNKELSIIKNVCDLALSDGLIKKDPAKRIKFYKKVLKPIIFFKPQELKLIFKNCDRRQFAMYNVHVYWT